MKRGYFGIGVENPKTEANLGTLFRSAHIFGADFVFVIGSRYRKEPSDTTSFAKHLPFYYYADVKDFITHIPAGCKIVGVELADTSIPIKRFCHFERSIYILGNERMGLTKECIDACDVLVQIPGSISLNVSVAGSILMFHRLNESNNINDTLLVRKYL